MKKTKSLFILALILSLVLIGCGKTNSKVDISNLEYIEESEIAALYSNPLNFKNKGVKLYGKVFKIEEDGDNVFLQVWVNVNGDDENTIVMDFNSENTYKDGDLIFINGFVKGEFEGENAFGGKIIAPSIEAIKIKESNYIDAFSPTIKKLEVNQEIDQYGAKVILKKIEFADNETRLYISINNESNYDLNIWTHSAKVIQKGKQFEDEYNYDSDYPEIQSDLVHGVSTEGILVFSKLDKDYGELKFIIDGSSDNWDIEIKPYEFNINW
ncbi:MAG TPA: hypothetical protein VFC73_07800 [Syntrophomonadaceae bacterium]|nr:hypothetical protein [Syntrophomonadaceae bacterium]